MPMPDDDAVSSDLPEETAVPGAALPVVEQEEEEQEQTEQQQLGQQETDRQEPDQQEPIPGPAPMATPTPAPTAKRRRWPRRVLATVLALFLLATSSSFIYNAATSAPAAEPAGLRFVTADGIRTRYLEWGTTGPVVVLVHGFAESADTFDPLGSALAADHRRVYALDLTGWGYSQRLGPYDADHQARQLLGFLDALHLQAPVLVGHSTGAAVVAAAVLDDPSRASGLVFLDGDGLDTGAGAGADWLQSILINPSRTTLLRLAIRQDWLIRQIYDTDCGPGCPYLDAAGVDQWRRPLQVAGAQDALWNELAIVGLPAARIAELAGLRMPKAVVFGADDGVFPHSDPDDTAQRIGAPAPTIIPGARHLSFISNPDQVAAAIIGLPASGGN